MWLNHGMIKVRKISLNYTCDNSYCEWYIRVYTYGTKTHIICIELYHTRIHLYAVCTVFVKYEIRVWYRTATHMFTTHRAIYLRVLRCTWSDSWNIFNCSQHTMNDKSLVGLYKFGKFCYFIRQKHQSNIIHTCNSEWICQVDFFAELPNFCHNIIQYCDQAYENQPCECKLH